MASSSPLQVLRPWAIITISAATCEDALGQEAGELEGTGPLTILGLKDLGRWCYPSAYGLAAWPLELELTLGSAQRINERPEPGRNLETSHRIWFSLLAL